MILLLLRQWKWQCWSPYERMKKGLFLRRDRVYKKVKSSSGKNILGVLLLVWCCVNERNDVAIYDVVRKVQKKASGSLFFCFFVFFFITPLAIYSHLFNWFVKNIDINVWWKGIYIESTILYLYFKSRYFLFSYFWWWSMITSL